MNEPHEKRSDRQLQLLRELLAEHASIDCDVFAIAKDTWVIHGVFPYDGRSGQVEGPPSTHFRRDQQFAAQVEWDHLPAGMVVAARWYDSLDAVVGSVGPASAGTLARGSELVPVVTPSGLRANLPGSYTLTIVRYSGGQQVELLDSQSVVVLHDP